MSQKTTVIAEAGVNHNGEIEMALELVDAAAEAGANVVKFQTFKATDLVSKSAQKADYQKRSADGDSQLDMLRKLELDAADHKKIIQHCQKRGIRFLSSPFDGSSLELLISEFGLRDIKLGSGELTNGPLLLDVARTGANVLLSTGMSSLSEVEEALGVLAFGMSTDASPRSRSDFLMSLTNQGAWTTLQQKVTLLHCTSDYPASPEDTNLAAMDTLKQAFGLAVGYSDHTVGNEISFAAVARGASVIEKHFTLDRSLPGPDHAASLEPDELRDLVQGIHKVEQAIGSCRKQPTEIELETRKVARKSLHAARNISKGQTLAAGDLSSLRPGDGVSPMEYWDLLTRPAEDDVEAGAKLP
ncbi:MAG: N-acetylneuraminate synthase [Dinoroseobacter sp.]|nr:N-acetylneuraminate synthase [Dinoroseobacter sp.]